MSEPIRYYWYVTYSFGTGIGSVIYDTDSSWFPIKAVREDISKKYCDNKKTVILSWTSITKEQFEEVDDEAGDE